MSCLIYLEEMIELLCRCARLVKSVSLSVVSDGAPSFLVVVRLASRYKALDALGVVRPRRRYSSWHQCDNTLITHGCRQ